MLTGFSRKEAVLTNVLLSVKPRFAEAIVQGRKEYELRRAAFKQRDIGQVYVYSTSPVGKIVGSFEVEEIIEDTPNAIWEMCRNQAAISEYEFFRYFNGAATAFAIKLAKVERFIHPLDPSVLFEDFRPPQSFRYVDFTINIHDGNGRSKRSGKLGGESMKRDVRTDRRR